MRKPAGHREPVLLHSRDATATRYIYLAIMDETQVRGLLQRVLDPGRNFFPTEGCAASRKYTSDTQFVFGTMARKCDTSRQRPIARIKGGKLELARADLSSRLSFLLIEFVAEARQSFRPGFQAY